jgi:hypothetical protein
MAKAFVCAGMFVSLLGACATGGGGDDPGKDTTDAAVVGIDASTSMVPPDASVKHDGGMMPTPDAATPAMDAGSGLFCTTNSQCTVSGECCVTLGGPNGFCAPGSVVLGQCVPQ